MLKTDDIPPPVDLSDRIMLNLKDLISDAKLEKKMEAIMLEWKGRVEEIGTACGGLTIIHKQGPCIRSEKERVQDVLTLNSLRVELLGQMEDFRERRGEDYKLERIVYRLVKSLNERGRQERRVTTKPKIPPTGSNESFKRYKNQV